MNPHFRIIKTQKKPTLFRIDFFLTYINQIITIEHFVSADTVGRLRKIQKLLRVARKSPT